MSTSNYFLFKKKITCLVCLVGSDLNEIFQLKAQSCIFTKSLFSLEAEAQALFATVSSANNFTSVVRPGGRSLM